MGIFDSIAAALGGTDAPQSYSVDPNSSASGATPPFSMTNTDPSPYGAVPGAADPSGGFDWSKALQIGAPALAGVYGMVKGGSSDKTMAQLAKLAGPYQKAGNQALQAYTSGQLTPAQQAQIDKKKQADTAAYQQYLAKAGIPESSAMADLNAKVNQDALVQQQQMLDTDFKQAVAASGFAGTTMATIAAEQLRQDQAAQAGFQNFMKALSQLGTVL